MSTPSIIDASEWSVGHPSQNKSFVATVVIASLVIAGFFIGCGFMIYYWVRSWRSKDTDNYKPSSTSGSDTNEKAGSNVDVDLEAQRQRPGTPPPERTYESEDESPIVQVSRWRQETVSVGGSESSRSQSQASSTRSSSDLSSVEGHLPERPRSRDFHELYPSN